MTLIKFCNTCKTEKSIHDFYKRTKSKDGLSAKCKSCSEIYKKEWNRNNKEKIKQYQQQYNNNNSKIKWCRSTIQGHKSRGCFIAFSTTELLDFISDKKTCQICGCKLKWIRDIPNGRKTFTCDSPTLDRINNEKYITIKNIQILCRECNTAKGTKTMDQFIKYCSMINKKFGD